MPQTAKAEPTERSSSPASTQAMVRFVDVHKSFGRQHVLRGINFEFQRGHTTVVLGPSGCGKSVMLKHIVGLLRPDRGQVWFQDVRVDTLSETALVAVRRQVGFLFQQSALFDSMSVRENIAFPLREHTELDRDAREAEIKNVLGMVGLLDSIDKMPADLSGGQRKRVALARAIVLRPSLMLYDEPTTGLDPIRSDVINELILKLQRELNMTSIVVTHDLTSAFKVANDMMMLHEGHVVMQGTPEDFRESPDPIVQRFLRGEATADELSGINAPAHAAHTRSGA
jgi:phospholipid/cholesterol/gamma-HCH transport system ATP-binding protein